MILTAHQPAYLPWLGLFSKISQSDTFVFYDTVQYSKWDFSSRNKIKTAKGWMWLTVPVHTGGKHGQIFTEVKIDNTQNWKKKHWNSIKINYCNAPYFDLYCDFFEDVYQREWIYLTDLDEHITRYLIDILGIKVNFVKPSDSLVLEGKKSALALDMCIKMNTDVFIFGSGGENYAKVEDFESAGIKVIFDHYQHPTYTQIHGDFISHLSVIDLLFNCGPKSLDIIKSGSKSSQYE